MTWISGNEVAITLAAAIALYTVARTGPRQRHLTIAVVAALVMMVTVAAVGQDDFVHEVLGEGAQMLLPIAIGDAAHSSPAAARWRPGGGSRRRPHRPGDNRTLRPGFTSLP